MIELGINIDHVATVRQARRTYEPDPVIAAALAEQGGADGITFHLREDRRHIQDRDVQMLMQTVTVKTNMELACADEVVAIAIKAKPDWALLVPESREEVTTEGGLDVLGDVNRVRKAVDRIKRTSWSACSSTRIPIKLPRPLNLALMRLNCTRDHMRSRRKSNKLNS